ncbi:MAG: hypothetical protein E6Q59_01940 [Nitrosomonas sp.]|nr:MAG: hypothetical protein E6Q59_01940 [Nitrosomonas sp.]
MEISASGKLVTYGWLNNYSNLINYGSYINSSISGSLSNSNTVTNYGYVENHGTLAQTSTGIFYNYGTVDNFQSPYYGDGWVSIMGGDLFNRGIFL